MAASSSLPEHVRTELQTLRQSERKLQQQVAQLRRRESTLVLRLALKERESAELSESTQRLRDAAAPQNAQLMSLMLDPAMNAEIRKLREQAWSQP